MKTICSQTNYLDFAGYILREWIIKCTTACTTVLDSWKHNGQNSQHIKSWGASILVNDISEKGEANKHLTRKLDCICSLCLLWHHMKFIQYPNDRTTHGGKYTKNRVRRERQGERIITDKKGSTRRIYFSCSFP